MRTIRNWTLMSLLSLALIARANADDKKALAIKVDPNQVVVQVYGIV